MSNDPRYSFAVARFSAAQKHPYLSSAYMALTMVENVPANSIKTMGVDKRWRLYADPTVWEQWTVKQQATVLYHEIWHLVRGHFGRMEAQAQAHPYLTNISQDCEINDDIIAEGLDLPKFPPCPKCKHGGGPCTPKMFNLPDGKMAEEYYQSLLSYKLNCPCECHQGGGDGSGDGFPNEARPGAGSCGSASGAHRPWELPDEGGADGEQGISEARGELIRQQVAKDIRDHAKQAGSIPEGWRLWADEVLSPKVNWRKELASCLRRTLNDVAGMVDFSYKRPARRADGDIIMPSLRRPIPNPGFIWDTSGSMRGTESNVLAEVGGVIKSVAAGVTVICCDADVASVGKVFNPRQVQIAGGGGTDMRPAIDYAIGVRPKLDVLVIASDCYVYDGWGPVPRGMKVIVADVGDGQGQRPAWPHRYIKVDRDA